MKSDLYRQANYHNEKADRYHQGCNLHIFTPTTLFYCISLCLVFRLEEEEKQEKQEKKSVFFIRSVPGKQRRGLIGCLTDVDRKRNEKILHFACFPPLFPLIHLLLPPHPPPGSFLAPHPLLLLPFPASLLFTTPHAPRSPFQLIRLPRSRSQQLLLVQRPLIHSLPVLIGISFTLHTLTPFHLSLSNFVLLPHLPLPSLFDQVSKRNKSSRHHVPPQQHPPQQQPGGLCRR